MSCQSSPLASSSSGLASSWGPGGHLNAGGLDDANGAFWGGENPPWPELSTGGGSACAFVILFVLFVRVISLYGSLAYNHLLRQKFR